MLCRFFKNKGAVAGVFLIVGLALTSIFLWLIFAARRRRGRRVLEREAAVAASQGHRSPLVDEDDMAQRPGPSMPVTVRPPSAYFDGSAGSHDENTSYDPYVGYTYPAANASNPYTLNRPAADGYVTTRTSSPPPSGSPRTDSFGHNPQPSTSNSAENGQHSRSYSFSSYEPLLAAAGLGQKTPPGTPGPGQPPTPPPRSPMRPPLAVTPGPSASRQLTEDTPKSVADERLHPALAQLGRSNTTASRIRDDQDYSRPVLGVSYSFP